MDELVAELEERRRRYRQPPESAAERQRRRGKMLARERVELLCDPGSFFELGLLAHEPGITTRQVADPEAPADGIITGVGLIDGSPVCIAADDATVFGGARGSIADRKIRRLRDLAARRSYPLVMLEEGSAGRIQDAIGAISAGVGSSFKQHLGLQGKVPTVAAIMGYCFGGPAFFAAMSDFVPMVRGTGFIAMSGPPVIRAGTGQTVTPEEIGGPEMQARRTGMVDYVADDDAECLQAIRRFLSYPVRPVVPASDPVDRQVPELAGVVPSRFRQAYDMHEVLHTVLDDGDFFEVKPDYGGNILTGLGRLGGRAVGIVASQPKYRAGMLEQPSARKTISFLELCERLRLPVVFIQDVPGFLVGKEVEENGQVRDAADLIVAVMRTTVPKITLILRKSYGLSYLALGGKEMGADFVFAWPSAEIGLMGPEAAARTMLGPTGTPDEIEDRTKEYRSQMSAYIAAGNAYIDDVITPAETRRVLCTAVDLCGDQRTDGAAS